MRTLAELRRDGAMYLSRRLNRSLVPPDRVSVNVTLRCNLKCTMCTTCYDAPELSTDEIKGIIDQTAAWGVEVFNPLGGEPFMRNDIEELLAYAVRRGFYVTVTTNGTLITERRAAAIASVPADRLHFNISMDGDEPAHDLVRSEGMWRRAIQGLERIRAADRAAGNARRKILSNTILHAQNIDRFEAILDQQAALGFDGVQILNLFRAGEDAPPEAANLWFRPRHHDQLDELAERLAQRAEAQATVGYRIQNRPQDLRHIPGYYRDALGPLEAPCWAGWKELYINADGAAIMCDGKLDFLAGAFGNVREQTLQQLWQSPALVERRRTVKTCSTPCIQDCYLRQSSDSGRALLSDAARLVQLQARQRLAKLQRGGTHLPRATLRLELSDVCPCGQPGCTTPGQRWTQLIAECPEAPHAGNWNTMRDRGYVDFGRGFMGFEVVRRVVEDLEGASLRFGTLCVSWRGEPLLHPEFEPIWRYLLDRVGPRGVADRLQIETDGRFLTEGVAALASRPVPQTWVVDLGKGGGAGVALLQAQRGPQTRLVLAVPAAPLERVLQMQAAHSGFPPVAGRLPAAGDVLWIRRADHTNFRGNQQARDALQAAAEALQIPAELGAEDRPRACGAPARSPTVSWDGKVALCTSDVLLAQTIGEVTSGSFSAAWSGPARTGAAATAAACGVPDHALCRDCAMPWSPNGVLQETAG